MPCNVFCVLRHKLVYCIAELKNFPYTIWQDTTVYAVGQHCYQSNAKDVTNFENSCVSFGIDLKLVTFVEAGSINLDVSFVFKAVLLSK